jgi:hypothetical protein
VNDKRNILSSYQESKPNIILHTHTTKLIHNVLHKFLPLFIGR